MLHLVPLAGSWGKVADRNLQAGLVGQPLQLPFPETQAVAIAAPTIRGDEQTGGPWIQPPPFVPPTLPPEPVPIKASPSSFLAGSFVTRLMDPPSAFGPNNGEEKPLATCTSAVSLVRNRLKST